MKRNNLMVSCSCDCFGIKCIFVGTFLPFVVITLVMNFESNTVIEIDLIEFCAYLQ